MTNHWADMDNSSMFFVMGANPVENHPASMAHVNAARYGSKKAKLIVVDPRKTRTAQQADLYVRIRPGTNIAFINGVMNYIFTEGYTNDPTFAKNFDDWHNNTNVNWQSEARTFRNDAGTSPALTRTVLADAQYGGVNAAAFRADTSSLGIARAWPKYADSRFKVTSGVAAPVDYQRASLTVTGGTYTGMPIIADTIGDPDCVMAKLKQHVAPYTKEVAADICGCAPSDIAAVGDEFIKNSRMSSIDFTYLIATPQDKDYKAATILYAMGITQHTSGSQNIRDFAILQTMLGNMGRAGGGINALRGIHNVQGSTDMGTLFDSIPGYSGNPGVGVSWTTYVNGLYGNRVSSPGVTGGAVDAYKQGGLGFQQKGFWNMTTTWFAKYGTDVAGSGGYTSGDIDKMYELWPKGNGNDHITMFRQMKAGNTTAAVVWGQNPAVTEPNQSAVRDGLEALDTLVVVDMFETETAACKRKPTGVTYLLPACAHVEEAGSVTNSGRWLQWRQRARKPYGNSKADIEMMLRLAKALDTANAFTHISAQWTKVSAGAQTWIGGTNPYTVLYGTPYGYDGTSDFELVGRTSDDGIVAADGTVVVAPGGPVTGSEAVTENLFQEMGSANSKGSLWIWLDAYVPAVVGVYESKRPALVEGASVRWTTTNRAKSRDNIHKGEALNYPRWGYAWIANRRVLYNNLEVPSDEGDYFVAPDTVARLFTTNPSSTIANYAYTYRAYNKLADVPTKGIDATIAKTDDTKPHKYAGRFPAHTEPIETPRRDLADKYGRNTASGAALVKSDSNVALWSNSPAEAAYSDPLYTDTGTWAKDAALFPLVLTTIRCVEHFQGGPITRNNSWNVEAEPVPWIEINSQDARTYNIKDGDWVNIVTARSNSMGQQEGRTNKAGWAKGFKARVGVGLQANQRVAPGVVAIPWHWGDQGLSTGSRANDLCIDAFDANTIIPEYKACLCRISTNSADVPA